MLVFRTVAYAAVLIPAALASPQAPPSEFSGAFSGQYHCGGVAALFELRLSPGTGPLGFPDPDAPVVATLNLQFRRSLTQIGNAAYRLTGHYDSKTGRFRLDPDRVLGDRPPRLQMTAMEGTMTAPGRLTARLLDPPCELETLPPGASPPSLPAPPTLPTATPNQPPFEMRVKPSDVTNYLDVSARPDGFEYWVTAWSEPPGVVHEGDPIDESIARRKREKFACGGSRRVIWEANGVRGSASDRVDVTERYVIECLGDCKGLFYLPQVGAQVVHFGLSEPLPTLQIKSVSLGGSSFSWRFTRRSASQPPPDIWVHRWVPQVGWGMLDPGPAEVERRIESAPPCRAPRSDGR